MIYRLAFIALPALLATACVNGEATMAGDDADPAMQRNSAAVPVDPDDEQRRRDLRELMVCDGASVQDWIGRRYTPASDRTLRERSGAATVRVIRPGEVASADYLTDRLTLELDEGDRITAIRCG